MIFGNLSLSGALAIVAVVLFAPERRSVRSATRHMDWNPAVIAMGLLSCALTMDAMQWLVGAA